MKVTRILAIAALSSIGLQSIAQENVSLGPVVGASFSRMKGDIANTDWRTGPTVGVFLNYSILEQFGIKTQLTYTQMGTAYSSPSSVQQRLDYVQLPVLATLYLNERGNKFRPKLMAGPYVGMLVGAKSQTGENINKDGRYNTFDAGVQLGGGFNYRIGTKTWLNLDVVYGHGLADISKSATDAINNRQWGVNLGLSFPLGKYSPSSGRFTPSR